MKRLFFSTSMAKFSYFVIFNVCMFSFSTLTDAIDHFDPNGNITIKWDIMQWNGDGYIARITIFNFQLYRHIEAPGWSLEWTWAKHEVIWSMLGGETTEQGDCSKFKSNPPHCCKKNPTVVDMLPGTPYNQQFGNCCKGGVISSWVQDQSLAVSAFQLTVGSAGTSMKAVRTPKNFALKAPGGGYSCAAAKNVSPSKFISQDGRRVTQALKTWNIKCTYSQIMASTTPTCCVSLSAFYNDTIVPCNTCSCGCQHNDTHPGSCVEPSSPYLQAIVSEANKDNQKTLVQCTTHMCPIRVHWHVKVNYREYWRIKITVTNFNYRMNFSSWNLVAQHPNFGNLTQIYSFQYKPLEIYKTINDTAMLFGLKFYNDLLMQAGEFGNVQSELLFRKDKTSFTFSDGWAFPRKIYFNGDQCVMPPPDVYPHLPDSTPSSHINLFSLISSLLLSLAISYGFV